MDTTSERDFHALCNRQGWTAEKLIPSTETGARTPDFLVRTSTGYEFVAEVTQFEPDPPTFEEGRVRRLVLGNALRAKLNAKKSQARRYADRLPTLIVIAGQPEHIGQLDPLAFDSALYGEITMTVHVPADPRVGVRFDDDTYNAGRRFFGREHNTRVSAVAALNFAPQVLRVYHNAFARIPLDHSKLIIGTDRVEHYVKSEPGATGWARLYASPLGGDDDQRIQVVRP